MYLLTTHTMKQIIKEYNIGKLIQMIGERLKQDFGRRESFICSPRFAHYLSEWVIELMPIGNKDYFSYKYVNGHPGNVAHDHPSVLALGQLSDCHTGMPLLMSEMTILTALRTAATTQLVASHAAQSESHILCMIGNGSQSIFQTIAICDTFPITTIQYYDVDLRAMQTYADHIQRLYPDIVLVAMSGTHEAASWADIIITVTEQFGCHSLISPQDVKAGAFIAGVGGDCPGKTEIDPGLVRASSVIVEYEPQTRIEWEIQHCPDKEITAHIRELVQGKKAVRQDKDDIILFDSVGFALEDYSALHVMYGILSHDKDAEQCSLVPEQMDNVKDLYGYAVG